jgi:antitoxin (DNA-binding transcriptional repressor) of toxin-antitoxin stability system
MLVNLDTAKAGLSRVIEAVAAGEEVVIVDGETPMAKLTAMAEPRFKIGILQGKLIGDGPNFFEPPRE